MIQRKKRTPWRRDGLKENECGANGELLSVTKQLQSHANQREKKKNSSELLILVPLVAEVHLGASVGCDKTVTEMPIESQSIIQPVLIVSNKTLIRQSK